MQRLIQSSRSARFVVVLTFALMTACGSVSAAQRIEPDPANPAPAQENVATSGTRTASQELEIGSDRFTPNLDEISRLADSVATVQAQKILNAPPQRMRELMDCEVAPRDGSIVVNLSVHLPDDPQIRKGAKEFANSFVSEVKRGVEQSRTKSATQQLLDPAKSMEADAQAAHDAAVKRMRDLEIQLRDKSGRIDVSPDRIADAAAHLDEERMRLDVEQAAKDARRMAIIESLAEASKKLEAQVKDDPIAAEFQKVVESRQERIALLKKLVEAGQASTNELSQATEALAEARANVLQRQREAAAQAGGDVMADWNRELLTLTVDERELAARVAQIGQRLEKMRGLADSVDDLRRLQDEIQRTRDTLDRAREQLSRANEALQELAQQPQVRLREVPPQRLPKESTQPD